MIDYPKVSTSNFWQTLRGPFSDVSTPKFASKYSFESSWRDLQNLQTFAPLRIQNFSWISSTFFACWQLYSQFFTKRLIVCNCCPKFTNFYKKSQRCSAMFAEKDHNILVDSSQISWDFATKIVEFSENVFGAVKKSYLKIRS